jgi:hypothetical protein
LLIIYFFGLSAQKVVVEHVSTYATEIFDEEAAEVISYGDASKVRSITWTNLLYNLLSQWHILSPFFKILIFYYEDEIRISRNF